MYNYGWKLDTIVPLLAKYKPDTSGPVVLFDPYENYGCMLRTCACLGWRYFGKAVTKKIQDFVRINWASHVQKHTSPAEVCFYLLYIFLIV